VVSIDNKRKNMYQSEEEPIIIGEIIAKEIQGIHLTEAERGLLQYWLSLSDKNQDIYLRCKNTDEQQQAYEKFAVIDSKRAFARIKKKAFPYQIPHRTPVLKRLYPYIIAASVLLVGVFGTYLLSINTKSPADSIHQTADIDYAPAGNKATVTLSDGRLFELDQQHQEIFIDEKGLNYQDGQLVAQTESVVSVKISTPRGGVYSVTLPDGTRVRLNAGSELNYPVSFANDKREVSLEGEAYFEVAKKTNQPFLVNTEDQQVTVLGTHFNIEAYTGSDLPIKTTLANQMENVLEPGQQSLLQNGRLSKKKVDIEQELAWLNGKFNFDGKRLKEVMDEVSRWYNVDVVYKGSIPDIEFFGGTFRTGKLSTILSLLESNNITYQMTTDNKIIIAPAKEK
jgi:transmembrane sensor